MLIIKLKPAVAERLARFMAQDRTAVRTDHWRRYGKLNEVRVEGDRVFVRAGAGFDSEYELNFRRPTLKEKAGRIVRALAGNNDLRRYRKAYETLWSLRPAVAESPHSIIAQHYLRLIQPHRAHTYLEIGAGTGYAPAPNGIWLRWIFSVGTKAR